MYTPQYLAFDEAKSTIFQFKIKLKEAKRLSSTFKLF